MREFLSIFLKELLGLPFKKEVDVPIDVLPGTVPIAQSPYRVTSLELAELKVQLQELLGKRFIRPSTSL